MSGGKVTLNAPTGIDYKTPANMNVQSRNMDLSDHNRIHGCLESETGTFVDKNGVALGTHTHNKGAKPEQIGGRGKVAITSIKPWVAVRGQMACW